MNYTDAFAIDSVAYNKRENTNIESYKLNNFDYYKPKLIDDFYLKYFTKVLLFEIDILDLEDFLDFHSSNCENSNKLIKILDLKITAKIDEIILNAKFSMGGDGGGDSIELEAGLEENKEFIYHPLYEDFFFYHTTALNNLQSDLEKRKLMINDYISKVKSIEGTEDLKTLKWIGKPSHLGFIINQLIEFGYIEPPVKHNKDINISELSRNIVSSFSMSKGKVNTIVEFSKEESLNFIKLSKRFKDKCFYLPHSSEFD